jgi:predicted metal-binding membrane protein
MASTTATPTLSRLTLQAAALLVVAAGAWVAVLATGSGMAVMPGTMGLSFGVFVAVWALMMTAMMLPTVAPFVAMYTRTLPPHRTRRTAELAVGYLLVWALAGIPAYAVAWLAGSLADSRPVAARVTAVAVFTACGLYQLTPAKDRCLTRCRSPFGSVLHYASFRGPLRDARVGMHHGLFCLGCCWAFMAVLIAVGLMNVAAMVVLTAVVLAEKTWRHGRRLSIAVGVVALVLAVVVAFRPSLAGGLYPGPDMSGQQMSQAPVGRG